jgi:hypothetical protein
MRSLILSLPLVSLASSLSAPPPLESKRRFRRMKCLVGTARTVLWLSLSGLVFSQCCFAQTKSMNKEELAEHGFAMFLPDEVGFAQILKDHGFSSPPSPRALAVMNTSKKAIVALGIQYLARCADGTELPINQAVVTAPQGLLDPGQPNRGDREPVIEAGGSRIIGPGGVLTASGSARTYLEMVPACTVVGLTAKADSVVYEDGAAFGPDNMKVLDSLQTEIAAQQDLVGEISGRVATGEQIAAVLGDLSARFPRIDLHASPWPNETLYVKYMRHYVRLLSSEQRRSGDLAVVNRLRHYAFTARPTIHRKGGN